MGAECTIRLEVILNMEFVIMLRMILNIILYHFVGHIPYPLAHIL